MSHTPVRVQASAFMEKTYVAICRRCLWYRSYPTHAVAVHAASQHVIHWLKKEQRRRQRRKPWVSYDKDIQAWLAGCVYCVWGRPGETWEDAIKIALFHGRMTCRGRRK